MAKGFHIKGMNKFMKNLNKEIRGIKNRTHAGLVNAAIIIQRKAEPGTPLDLGNLRASWFTASITGSKSEPKFKSDKTGELASGHLQVLNKAKMQVEGANILGRPMLVFGYTANYAAFVHENVGAKFKRPTAHARWLFKALQDSRKEILEEIRKAARIR